MSDLQSLVNMLKAAGEVTRLRLLALLATGELSVKDLTAVLEQSQPRVSRHLKLLTEAGLVERNAEGAWAYFALNTNSKAGRFITPLLDQLDPEDPDFADDRARLKLVRAEQRDAAAQYFTRVADSWDFIRNLHASDEAVEAAIQEQMGNRHVELMLDIGTGTGRMLELLRNNFRSGLGIDFNRDMISFARSKLAQAGVINAQVRLGDITEPGEIATSADLITIHQVLHYFDDPGGVLKSVRGALKPRGEILVVDFLPHELELLRSDHAHRRLGLSVSQMEQWADGADLKVTKVKEVPAEDGEDGLTVCLWVLRDKGISAVENTK